MENESCEAHNYISTEIEGFPAGNKELFDGKTNDIDRELAVIVAS
jgi:hypothetical protein